jgi:predicted nucleic acid-binding protein
VIRVVVDTNILVDWLNQRRHEQTVTGAGRVRYLSTVVLMELRVGAITRRADRELDAIERAFGAAGRLLVPTARVYDDTGRVLRELRRTGRDVRHASFVHDVLIALSARSIGASVVTRNVEDFAAIRELRPFEIVQAI